MTGAAAQGLRLAVHHGNLGRDGPGLLLRDIRNRADAVLATRNLIVDARPDIVLLLDFDHDRDLVALGAFQNLLAEAGHSMAHAFSLRPNSGMATGVDLDGDGRTGTPDDAQGWGNFAGAGGMAILSRFPVDHAAAVDHSRFLWRDLPGALIPEHDGAPFPSPEVFDLQRLSSTGHWQVPVVLPSGQVLTVLAWHAGPPVFGGPFARNRRRNHDETAFWAHLLDGNLAIPPPTGPLVLLGNSNLDPVRGDGIGEAMQSLLAHPALHDPRPVARHPRLGIDSDATADWPRGPGALRVSYILPGAMLEVLDSGLTWPSAGATHALVWVDLRMPEP